MDFRKVDGGGKSRPRRQEAQTILKLASILAKAKRDESRETELIDRMIRKAEAGSKHLVPLIEAYLMGLLLGARFNSDDDQDDRSAKGNKNI